MLRRRLAAVALAALTVALFTMPGMASGAQTGDQALVRVAHFAPGLLKGDVYVIYVNGRLQLKGVPFKTSRTTSRSSRASSRSRCARPASRSARPR